MKYLLPTLFLAFIFFCTSCATSKQQEGITTLYLVRHAEKADDSRDPELSIKGKDRAQSLSKKLKSKRISKVYSSNYKRTKSTAQPTADQSNIAVEVYDPSNHTELINRLKNRSGQSILIVGHSNSTPALVNQLLGGETYKSLDHEEYDKLFILSCDKSWKCTPRIETYN